MSMKKENWDSLAPIYEILTKPGEAAYKKMYAFIRQTISGKNVLEVAAGTGLVARHVADAAHFMIATDFSERMIREAIDAGRPANLQYEVEDATDLPYENNEFDVVIASNLLNFADDPDKVLQEIHRVLKTGGILIAPCFLYDESMSSSRRAIFTLVNKISGTDDSRKWSQEEYIAYLRQCGLRIRRGTVLKAAYPMAYVECRFGDEEPEKIPPSPVESLHSEGEESVGVDSGKDGSPDVSEADKTESDRTKTNRNGEDADSSSGENSKHSGKERNTSPSKPKYEPTGIAAKILAEMAPPEEKEDELPENCYGKTLRLICPGREDTGESDALEDAQILASILPHGRDCVTVRIPGREWDTDEETGAEAGSEPKTKAGAAQTPEAALGSKADRSSGKTSASKENGASGTASASDADKSPEMIAASDADKSPEMTAASDADGASGMVSVSDANGTSGTASASDTDGLPDKTTESAVSRSPGKFSENDSRIAISKKNEVSVSELLKLLRPERVLTIGDECAISLRPFEYLHIRYPEGTGILWVDARTRSYAGDDAPEVHKKTIKALIRKTFGQPFEPSEIFYIKLRAARDVSTGDFGAYQKTKDEIGQLKNETGIRALFTRNILETEQQIREWMEENALTNLLVHVDISDFRALLEDEKGVNVFYEMMKVLEDVTGKAQTDIKGMTIAEYNPGSMIRIRTELRKLKIFQ